MWLRVARASSLVRRAMARCPLHLHSSLYVYYTAWSRPRAARFSGRSGRRVRSARDWRRLAGLLLKGSCMSALKNVLARSFASHGLRRLFATVPIALLIAACGQKNEGAAGPGAGAAPPPAEVGVITVRPRRRRPDDRTAGPPRGIAGRPGAGARCRHPAEARVRRRQRREGGPAPVPDRSGAVPGEPRQHAGHAGARAGQPDAGDGAGRALQAAARSERGQQAGIHQRGRGAETGRGRCRGRPRRAADQPDQPRLCDGDRADLGPHRPRAGDRGRAGRPGRGDAARR